MAISPDAVVTFDRVEGYRVIRSFGFASGEASRPRNILRDTLRGIGTFIGLAPIEVLSDAERARSECLASLLERAERLGANGIVGLRFRATEAADGGTRVTAFGEAVLLEPLP